MRISLIGFIYYLEVILFRYSDLSLLFVISTVAARIKDFAASVQSNELNFE